MSLEWCKKQGLKLIELSLLEKDKELRIDNQYYLKNIPVKIDSTELAKLLLNIRSILDNISDNTIKKIRKLI